MVDNYSTQSYINKVNIWSKMIVDYEMMRNSVDPFRQVKIVGCQMPDLWHFCLQYHFQKEPISHHVGIDYTFWDDYCYKLRMPEFIGYQRCVPLLASDEYLYPPVDVIIFPETEWLLPFAKFIVPTVTKNITMFAANQFTLDYKLNNNLAYSAEDMLEMCGVRQTDNVLTGQIGDQIKSYFVLADHFNV
jgi:hypothetical protein